ncbi:MAG: protein kinase [Planctomycetes bacterium]|nr:protein kinase [Planctomycetota bacterium]
MPSRKEILLGKMALEREFLSKEDLHACIHHQENEAPDRPLGEILVEKGHLKRGQLEALLSEQKKVLDQKDTRTGARRGDLLFGKIVVARKLATPEQVHECVRVQEKYRTQGKSVSLGEILVSKKVLTPRQVKQILDGQKVTILTCPKCGRNYNVLHFDPERRYNCRDCMEDLVAAAHSGVVNVSEPPPATDAPEESDLSLPAVEEAPVVVAPPKSSPAALGDAAALGPEEDAEIEIQLPEEKEDELCGQNVGGYLILKKLGQGGMGKIYKARQISLDRIVVLKMLNDDLANNEVFLSRFQIEARSAARLNHPHIVQIYDVAESDNCHYFSMEYVEGENVGDILDRRGRLPILRALSIVTQVTEALREAHNNNIVHRDIKPDNILLTARGAAKLSDLGIAKNQNYKGNENLEISDLGVTVGTPYYISPEQAKDSSKVDCRADIYSLGASFYHMLTGRVPFYGTNPAVIFLKLANEEPPDPQKFNPLVPFAVLRVLRKMMKKDPAKRHQSSAELLEALRHAEGEIQAKRTRKKETIALTRSVGTIEPTETDISGLELEEEASAQAGEEKSAAGTPDKTAPVVAPPRGKTEAFELSPDDEGPKELHIAIQRRAGDRPVNRRKIPVLGILAVLVVAGGVVGGIVAFTGSEDNKDGKPPGKNGKPSSGNTNPEGGNGTHSGDPQDAAAKEAEKRFQDLRARVPKSGAHAEFVSLLEELDHFISEIPAELSKLAQSARDERNKLSEKADEALFAECQTRLAEMFKAERPDFRGALVLLQTEREKTASDRVKKKFDDRIGDVHKGSQDRTKKTLTGYNQFEAKAERIAVPVERKAAVDAGIAELGELAGKVLEEDAPPLAARKADLERYWSEYEERVARGERAKELRRVVSATVEWIGALEGGKPAVLAEAIEAVYAREEFASLPPEAKTRALAIPEAIGRMEGLLLAAVNRLVENSTPFDFYRVSAGGPSRITVTQYTRLEPENGIVVHCKEPLSLVYVARLTLDCYGSLLGADADITRPADRVAIALYLLAYNPDRRDEASGILREVASDAEQAPIYSLLVYARDYREVKDSVAQTEEPGIPQAERKSRWQKVAAAITLLNTLYAETGSEYHDAHAAELAALAERAQKGGR